MNRNAAFSQELYEDADLREDLTDDEAAPLFEWAAGIACGLDESHASDEDFEAATKQLRALIKNINRLVGQRSYATPDARQKQLEEVRAAAITIGLTPPDEPLTANAADSTAYMSTLLAQMQPTTTDAAVQAPHTETNQEFDGWRSWLNNLDQALSGDDER